MRWGIASVVILLAFVSAAHAAMPVTLNDIKRVAPQARSVDRKLAPVDHYLLKNNSGKTIGVAFLTSAIEPEVKGYVGEFDVLVGMDMKGAVTGVEILYHVDTPDYVEQVISSGFLKKFNRRTIERGFDDIDTVTGATISSAAIKRDIQTAAFEIHKKIIDSGIIKKGGGKIPGPFEILAIIAVVVLCAGAIVAVLKPMKRWIAFALWALSFLVTGVWLNAPITIGIFTNLFHLTLPVFLPALTLFIFAIIAALVKGNLYCAYLCPFGAVQEGAARLKLPKIHPESRVVKNLSWLRWIVLIATIFGIAVGVNAFSMIEPFATCFSRTFTMVILAQTGIVLVASLFFKRPWCRFFCPTGALLDILAQIGCGIRGKLSFL